MIITKYLQSLEIELARKHIELENQIINDDLKGIKQSAKRQKLESEIRDIQDKIKDAKK